MNDFLITILSFLFALGVIIVVHEAGHLLVAKAFGVRVLTFSVGFGKRLWGFRHGETEYQVSAIPLGGYVRLSGELPEEAAESTDPRDFMNKPRWQRILVYLAGPAMNVILAVLIFAGLFMVGMEVMNLPDMPPVVGGVEAGSSAEKAGLQRGDRIVAIEGQAVDNWQQVLMALITSPNRPLRLSVEREGRTVAATVTPGMVPKYEVGDSGGIIPALRPQITQVLSDGAAKEAGFRPGDEIRTVDGVPIADSRDFVSRIETQAGKPVVVEIMRDGQPMTLTVVPRGDSGVGRIGVGIGFYQKYGPARALSASVRYNVQIVKDTVTILGKVMTGGVPAKSAFAGPLEIAKQSGEAARRGFKDLLQLMGFLSISIAFMNLLPIPILDGGQITILAVEEVMRRDLSLRFKEFVGYVGLVMILLLMVTVIYFDIAKSGWLPKFGSEAPAKQESSAPAPAPAPAPATP
jgi:regulator of sigma E protease